MRDGTIGLIVLAAGHSRRFRSNKLLADFHGRELIYCVLEAIPKEWHDSTVVVTRYDAVRRIGEDVGIPVVMHDLPDQSDSIRVGMEYFKDAAGLLFLTADQPFLSSESLRRLAEDFRHHPEAVCMLGSKGQGGSPVIFPRSCFSRLRQLKGDVGGKRILKDPSFSIPIRILEASDPLELEDVDEVADLNRLNEARWDKR